MTTKALQNAMKVQRAYAKLHDETGICAVSSTHLQCSKHSLDNFVPDRSKWKLVSRDYGDPDPEYPYEVRIQLTSTVSLIAVVHIRDHTDVMWLEEVFGYDYADKVITLKRYDDPLPVEVQL